MGKGPLGLLKLHLIAKAQFCRFMTGPDLSNRGVFFKAALPSPDVEKCDQDGSRPPKTALSCHGSRVRTCPTEAS